MAHPDPKVAKVQVPKVLKFELADDMPFDAFEELLMQHARRGSGDKVRLAKKVSKNNFNIENSANRSNCPSARYFIDKVDELGEKK